MKLESTALFSSIKKRLSWLNQRQEVLAQNIANADTPKYRAKDLKPFQFRELLRRESMQVNMTTSSPDHLGGRRKRIRDFDLETTRQPFETSPTGNSVVLEEQLSMVNETHTKHRLTTELYKKHLKMLSMAVRGGN